MLNLASISTNLPSEGDSTRGLFVFRRLVALSRLAKVHAVRPAPYFPVLRRLDKSLPPVNTLQCDVCPMFYLPGLAKRWDGWWLARSIEVAVGQLHRSEPLDLIDAHFGYPEGVGGWLVGRELGIPVFITLRGVEQELLHVPPIRQQMVEAMNHCAGVIAVSESLKRAAVAGGVSSEQIAVIPNGIDSTAFAPGDRATARATLGIRSNTRIVVCVADLRQVKGHEILLRAFERADSNARLYLIGNAAVDRGYTRRLMRLIAALALVDRVVLVGRQSPDQVACWLRAADVFALASHREGCCNAILESLACGTPVVCTDVGDNARFVRDDTNGRVVPKGNSGAFADGLCATLRMNVDAKRVAGTIAHLAWERTARSVHEFFETRLMCMNKGDTL